MSRQLDKPTREALIEDLKEILQEGENMVENLYSIQKTYPDSLGDLHPMVDAMKVFQAQVQRYIDDLYVM